jgi:hypothetical protein
VARDSWLDLVGSGWILVGSGWILVRFVTLPPFLDWRALSSRHCPFLNVPCRASPCLAAIELTEVVVFYRAWNQGIHCGILLRGVVR